MFFKEAGVLFQLAVFLCYMETYERLCALKFMCLNTVVAIMRGFHSLCWVFYFVSILGNVTGGPGHTVVTREPPKLPGTLARIMAWRSHSWVIQ